MKFIVFAFITVLGLGMFTGCTGSVDSDDSGLTRQAAHLEWISSTAQAGLVLQRSDSFYGSVTEWLKVSPC